MIRAAALVGVLGLAPAAPAAAAQPDLAPALEHLRAGRPEAALEHLRALAARGHAGAMRALAALHLAGAGGRVDVERAAGWYCMLAHRPEGGEPVADALWRLAEYFRTGGGLPERRYRDARREREDPVRASFWLGVLAGQGRYYERVHEPGARLARIARARVAGELLEGERRAVERALRRWRPAPAPDDPLDCLRRPALPGPGG